MSILNHNHVTSQPTPAADDFCPPIGGLSIYRTIRRDLLCNAPKRPYLRAVNHYTKQLIFFQPNCGSWMCPACAARNGRKAILRAVHGYKVFSDAGHRIDFITLTSHRKLDEAASYSVLPIAWDKLRKRVSREVDLHEYFIVPEQHKDGRWHMHGLTTAILPQRWWKDNAVECGLGFMSDVSEVEAAGSVAGYVAKYTGKMMSQSKFPKGARRLRLSHEWPDLAAQELPDGWQFSTLARDKKIEDETDVFQGLGYAVVLADDVSAWSYIDLMG